MGNFPKVHEIKHSNKKFQCKNLLWVHFSPQILITDKEMRTTWKEYLLFPFLKIDILNKRKIHNGEKIYTCLVYRDATLGSHLISRPS